ncbi:hypothetical protein PT2222_210016 [Paraburkholderia tropica]
MRVGRWRSLVRPADAQGACRAGVRTIGAVRDVGAGGPACDESTCKDRDSPRQDQPTVDRNSLETRHARERSEVKNGAEGRANLRQARRFSEPRVRLARPATPGPGSPVDAAQTPFFIQKHEDS